MNDLVDACIYLMNIDKNILSLKDSPLFNIGVGKDLTINELAQMVGDIIGFKGEIINDFEKPDGTPQKLLDTSKINDLGWKPNINLQKGIEDVYRWYKDTLLNK